MNYGAVILVRLVFLYPDLVAKEDYEKIASVIVAHPQYTYVLEWLRRKQTAKS